MDPLAIQQQIRANSLEMHAAFSDLAKWEKEVSRRDADLKAGRLRLTKDALAQAASKTPIRGTASITAVNSDHPGPEERTSVASTSSTSEAQVVKSPPTAAPDVTETAEFLEAKEAGNTAFRKGELQAALAHYTRCAELAPRSSIPFANRAAVHLKLEAWRAAEEDCTLALAAERDNVKALYRRAVARHALGSAALAVEDLSRSLKVEPSNAAAKALLSKVRAEMEAANAAAKQKAAREQHEAELRRAAEEAEAAARSAAAVAARKKIVVHEVDDDDEDSEQEEDDSVEVVLKKTSKVEEVVEEVATPAAVEEAPAPPAVRVPAPPTPSSRKPAAAGVSGASPAAHVPMALPPPPTSALEFESAYRELVREPARLARYLASFAPTALPALLAVALDGDIFGDLFNALQLEPFAGDAAHALAFLEALTRVDRFSTFAMFLSRSDKVALDVVVEAIVASGDTALMARARTVRALYE